VPELIVEVLRAEEVCFVYFVYFFHSSVCLFKGSAAVIRSCHLARALGVRLFL
jgi:hypothetical protein